MSSTDVTPAALGKLPIALTLPDELWIKVLHHLGYKQLKRARKICKKLEWFIRGTEFDRVLYRAGPDYPAYEKGKKVDLHLMIEKTDAIFAKLEDAKMLKWPYDVEYLPKEYPSILDEFATSPTSTQIDIEMQGSGAPEWNLAPLVKSAGITVGQFFEHLAKYWSTPAPARSAEYAIAHFRVKDAKNVNDTDILGDHNGWSRWQDGVAQGGNRTHVYTIGFDS